jgi:hypothetical protein
MSESLPQVQNAPVCEGISSYVSHRLNAWQLCWFIDPSTFLIDGNSGPFFSDEVIQICQFECWSDIHHLRDYIFIFRDAIPKQGNPNCHNVWQKKTRPSIFFCHVHSDKFNTLRTGDANLRLLRFSVTTVKDR